MRGGDKCRGWNSGRGVESLVGKRRREVQIPGGRKRSNSHYFSLFTNVLVDEACNIAKERLLLDNTLHLRTTLSPDNIYDLLKLCLFTTCFQWGEKFYEQTHGAAMGRALKKSLNT